MVTSTINLAVATRGKCIACGTKENISTISPGTATDIFESKGILVKAYYQCMCDECASKPFRELQIAYTSSAQFPKRSILLVLNELRRRRLSTRGLLHVGIDEADFLYLTKLNKIQFNQLRELVPNVEANELMMFLMICCLGLPQRLCGIMFGVSQSNVSKCFQHALSSLHEYLAKPKLGLENISMEDIKNDHTPDLFRALFPKARLVGDGTYIYVQKSANFGIQKATYSTHKGRNLVKFLIFTAPDGYFVECLGPYFSNGKHNDEWLFNVAFEEENSVLRKYLDPDDDELILDRGFLRIDTPLNFHAPKPLARGDKQLNSRDATYSR